MNLQQLKESFENFCDVHNANGHIEFTQALIEHATLNDGMDVQNQVRCVNEYINDYFKDYTHMNLLNDRNLAMFKSFMIIQSIDLMSYINEARRLVSEAKEENAGTSVIVSKQKYETRRFNDEDFWFVNEVITNIIKTEEKEKGYKFVFMKKMKKNLKNII